MIRIALALTAVLTIPLTAVAQHDQHGAAGEKLGTAHFETSCNPATRADFDRAVALLHSFEFRPAMATFNKVLVADASCAVAYWGIGLCHWGNPFAGIKAGPPLERGLEAVQKGLATGSPTPREKAYIAAVSELYKNAATVPHRDRTLAYASAMEAVQRDNPKDVEAHIFYALAVNQTAAPTDKTYAAQLKAGEILEPLWQQYPDHPGLPHYIIHAYDHPPLAAKALVAAQRYAKIAPSAPHALHMPSHTFTRVGLWSESATTNVASESSALKQNVIGEALHAMDYQAYAYLQMAQDQKARAVLDRLPGIVAKLDVNAMGGAAPPVAGFYARNAIAARYALERGAWAEAAALDVLPSAFPYVDAITHFARALGAARSGKAANARPDVERLIALRDGMAAAKDAYWTEQLSIQHQVATAWITFAEGKPAEGLRLMRAAADAEDATDKNAISPGPMAPARELLGEMLLEAGNGKDALVAFEATMKKEPNRFRGALGAARAAEAAADRDNAARYYRQVLDIAKDADTQRPDIQRARAYRRLAPHAGSTGARVAAGHRSGRAGEVDCRPALHEPEHGPRERVFRRRPRRRGDGRLVQASRPSGDLAHVIHDVQGIHQGREDDRRRVGGALHPRRQRPPRRQPPADHGAVDRQSVPARIALFLAHASAGERVHAQALVTPDIEAVATASDVFPRLLAQGYAMAGAPERAIDFLAIAVDRGFINYPFLARYDPFFAALRRDSRFQQLLEVVRDRWEKFEG